MNTKISAMKKNPMKMNDILFFSYLEKYQQYSPQQCSAIMSIVEDVLPDFIRNNVDPDFDNLFAEQDPKEIQRYIQAINNNNLLLAMNQNEGTLSNSKILELYLQFLVSDYKIEDVDIPDDNVEPNEDPTTPATPVEHNDDDYPEDSEGDEQQFNLTKKERNPELRRRCIAYYKSLNGGRIFCLCCGFDFEKAYGEIGEDYIEIHHIEPHHTFKGAHTVDPKTKLIPLCSNCHSMIHRVPGRGTCMTLDELKSKYKGIKYNID